MASASSMPSLGQRQDLNSLLECSICLETFDDPRTLPCLHSFCKKCLENFVDGKCEDELNCPVCRYKFTLNEGGVAEIKRNYFICNMVEVLSIQHQIKCIPCSHCQQPSVGRCVTCELFMCEECFKPHNDYRGFQDHLVLTMDELSMPENQSKIKKISKCTQHPDKKLKYYCETCDQMICRHCMDFDHQKQHKFLPLKQAAQNKRKDLKKNCEMLERATAVSESEACVLKEKVKSLKNGFDSTERVINERKQQLLAKVNNVVDKKTNSMIEDAREVLNGKTKIIVEKIHEREGVFNRMKASADMARSLLATGNDEEIVFSYQSLQENVNDATKQGSKKELYAENLDVQSWCADEIDNMLIGAITGEFERNKPRKTTVCHETRALECTRTQSAPLSTCGSGRRRASFVAYVYENDYEEIQKLVQRYPNIQTGGDLFGLWNDERTVTIQQFSGPGKDCHRTTTSFHQDIEYLHKVGSLIANEEGLCNVGEWHSHHQRGMPNPSDGDRRTVFSNMPHLGLERFMLFIATIEGKGGKKRSHEVKLDDIKLRPFLFLNFAQELIEGEIEFIPGSNPHRFNNRIKKEIEGGAEIPPDGAKRISTSSDENYDWTSKNLEKKKGGKVANSHKKKQSQNINMKP